MKQTRIAMSHSAPDGEEPYWHAVFVEMINLRNKSKTKKSLTTEERRFISDVLKFGGELQLNDNSSFPGRASPEKMLKQVAESIKVSFTA